jgi:ketosteroid isomerase-like protein
MTYQHEYLVASLAARAAIADLVARHDRALERGDLEAYLETFLEDAVVEETGRPPAVGAKALPQVFERWGRRFLHVSAEPVVAVDGVRATQESRVLVLRPGGKVEVAAVGRYRDELAYERGAWRFARRELTVEAGGPE